MRKFDDKKRIIFVNPDSDLFQQSNTDSSKERFSPVEHIKNDFTIDSYDIVHIHFEFQFLKLDELIELLEWFKENNKPIVWTVHDRHSNEIPLSGNLEYEKCLFKYTDQLITLTHGCADWIKKNLGVPKREIRIIRHGYIEEPGQVSKFAKHITKDQDLFTILLGSFRPNKASVLPVINFLMATDLNSKRIKILCNPFPMNADNDILSQELRDFYVLIYTHPRVEVICKPFIEHDEITKTFIESHAIILPYLWGTHSGQLELARDCGCHVITPDIGFYKEQWDAIHTYNVMDGKTSSYASRYLDALIAVSKLKSLAPDTNYRIQEFEEIFSDHYKVYASLLTDCCHKIYE